MIQTILLDLVIHFFCGQIAALSARKKVKELPPVNTYLLRFLLVSIITFLPFAYYYIFYFHDWSWMYFVDGRTFPFAISLLMPAAYLAAGAVGFFAAQWLIKKDALSASVALCSLSGIFLLGMTLTMWKRFYFVGTSEAFYAGTATPLLKTPLLFVIIVMGFVFPPAFVYLIVKNAREK